MSGVPGARRRARTTVLHRHRRSRAAFGCSVGFGIGAWCWRHLSSAKVRAWRASVHPTRPHLPLAARAFGGGTDAILVLHGLGATSDYWSAAYDVLGRTHRVVVPDLLGFGRSLDEHRAAFEIDDHLDALDQLIADEAPGAEKVTVLAHSMGSALALYWARRHPERVQRVVCSGAPLYPDAGAARAAIARVGPMAKLFLLDTAWAQRACAFSCAHRTTSGWCAAFAEPTLPMPITRRSVLHTWPAYRDALTHLVLEPDWPSLLLALNRQGTPLTLLWGAQDDVGVTSYAERITHPRTQTITIVSGADHHLPITHSSVLLEVTAMPSACEPT